MASKKNVSPQRDVKKEAVGAFRCSCCSTVYKTQKGNYLKNSSFLFRGNNGFITVCKLCAEEQYKKLLSAYDGNAEKAAQQFCATFDYYFSPSIFASTGKEATSITGRILLYPSKLNMKQYGASGKSYLETIEENKNKPIEALGSDDSIEAEDFIYRASPETIKFFGHGYQDEEYEFMQQQFDEWIERYEVQSKSEEELIKAICVAQLAIRQTQANRDIKEIEKAMNTFQNLLKTADLKPNRAANEAALSAENSFGMLIKKLENERPVKKPNPEWVDVDDIHSYIDTYYLSHMCKLTKRPIPNEESYNEEMAKYTVKLPTYDDGSE